MGEYGKSVGKAVGKWIRFSHRFIHGKSRGKGDKVFPQLKLVGKAVGNLKS